MKLSIILFLSISNVKVHFSIFLVEKKVLLSLMVQLHMSEFLENQTAFSSMKSDLEDILV